MLHSAFSRRASLWLAVLAAVSLSVTSWASAQQIGLSRCAGGTWGPPKSVDGLKAKVAVRLAGESDSLALVRYPSVAAGRDTVFVFGNDIAVFDSSPVTKPLIVSLSIPEEDLEPPPGPFWFVTPMASLDREGRLHLVWAEPDESVEEGVLTRSRVSGLPLNRVWHAVRDQGRWTEPQSIYQSRRRMSWRRGVIDIDADVAGTIRVVLSESDRLVHLQGRGDDWQVQSIPVFLGGQPSLATVSARRLLIAYSGGEPGRSGRANDLLIVKSDDGGITWSNPQLVHRPKEERVQHVHALAGADGRVHLVWEETAGGSLRRAIFHSVSQDFGDTWAIPERLAAPNARNTQALVDACGVVHLVFEDWEQDQLRANLAYARWDGRWSAVEYPYPDLNSIEIALFLRPPGMPQLFWSARPVTAGLLRPWFVPVTAVFIRN